MRTMVLGRIGVSAGIVAISAVVLVGVGARQVSEAVQTRGRGDAAAARKIQLPREGAEPASTRVASFPRSCRPSPAP